jgi:hypothetical protein
MKRGGLFYCILASLLLVGDVAAAISSFDYQPSSTSCSDGDFWYFGHDVRFARIKGPENTKVFFNMGIDGCSQGESPECRLREYVIPGDRVLVARSSGGWVCGLHVPREHNAVGWILSDILELTIPDPKPSLEKWAGAWRYGDASLRIKVDQRKGALKVDGEARWYGGDDIVHYGEVHARGKPKGTELELKYSNGLLDCEVRLRLIDNALIVADNSDCGGMNVSFGGVYYRKTEKRKH